MQLGITRFRSKDLAIERERAPPAASALKALRLVEQDLAVERDSSAENRHGPSGYV